MYGCLKPCTRISFFIHVFVTRKKNIRFLKSFLYTYIYFFKLINFFCFIHCLPNKYLRNKLLWLLYVCTYIYYANVRIKFMNHYSWYCIIIFMYIIYEILLYSQNLAHWRNFDFNSDKWIKLFKRKIENLIRSEE